jgi:hypothetical protein
MTKLAACVLAVIALIAIACGGGSKSPAQQTLEARQQEDRQTPYSDTVGAYARDLCTPLRAFLESAGSTFDDLGTAEAGKTPSFDDFFTLIGGLEEPLTGLRSDLGDVEPPAELRSYHDALLDNLDTAIESLHALNQGDLSGFAATPAPTPQEPPGIDSAIIQECGDELLPVIDELGGELFGETTPAAEPTPAPGAIGETLRSGNVELVVNSVTDPYEGTDQSFVPAQGNRWVVADVSITNVSDKAEDFNVYDFTVRDADNFQYDSGGVDVAQDLGFGSLLPDETIRGNVGFEVPEGAVLSRLVYQPGFFGEGRIEILLP